jgi:nicotinamide-nucleotide amidase
MTHPIYASIITIGDELLIGQTIDTNSAWIGQELNAIGVWVRKRIAVGDIKSEIWNVLEQEEKDNDIIIITGGLGPTADDITKPLLCEYFGGTLVTNEAVQAHVIDFFTKRNRPIIQENIAQAQVPNVCEVLWNQYGTAPGMLFRKNNKLIFSLPGVPLEMKNILSTVGLNKIKNEFILPNVVHKTLVTAGKGESFIAVMLKDFESQLPINIKLAYLPKLGQVKLRLTGIDVTEDEIQIQFKKLETAVQVICYATEDVELETALQYICIKNKITIATAESCTGGNIANRITNISGSSNYFNGSIVSYTNQAKISQLLIPENLITDHTTVSEQVAIAMAKGALQQLKSNFAIATTGYLESEDINLKGLVWFAVTNGSQTESLKSVLPYDRINSKELATNIALNFLRKFISDTYKL